jgi:ethanolamine utilization protein EutN
MLLGRIVGSAWATRKYEGLDGSKMLIVQPLDKRLRPVGRPAVAVDVVDAGLGDLVFLVRAREASLALPIKGLPVDLAVVGVIDTVDTIEGVDLELPSGYTVFT